MSPVLFKIVCYRSHTDAINGSYSINSTLLNQVHTHKHLGVKLSSDLSWKTHVLTVAAKTNKLLGLLKITFGKCSEAIIIKK